MDGVALGWRCGRDPVKPWERSVGERVVPDRDGYTPRRPKKLKKLHCVQ
jgi:hypothetical protein